ncbi:MAG: 2-amino-4-hydroxy-6-hydroxymethyldihydropteridine diphosphokinase [Myxococcota bacterium]|nr:2-amino-4-hydroxy-6-hydroxymethyldihydropteridine diphosphokinase [Myxococcota bacterium]
MRETSNEHSISITAYVAVGSNIDPEKNIPAALTKLLGFVDVFDTSSFYRTPPLGDPGQPAFLNGVFGLRTTLAPRVIKFDVLRGIEADLGRIRTEDRYAPRPIDLDLILYGNWVRDEPNLRLPDPDIHTRGFVAMPLMQIAPDLILPDTSEPIGSLPITKRGAALEAVPALSKKLKRMIRK